jgi:hypothetical protein
MRAACTRSSCRRGARVCRVLSFVRVVCQPTFKGCCARRVYRRAAALSNRKEAAMGTNRGVVYLGPGKVEVQKID